MGRGFSLGENFGAKPGATAEPERDVRSTAFAAGGLDMLRILIADDHEVVRSGLRLLLEEHPGWHVCGEAATGRAAVTMAKALVPNIAIIDLTMPELNGLETARQIKAAVAGVEVLIFTMHESEQLVRTALAAGARGYLLKSDAVRNAVLAVEALAAHKPFFTSKVSEMLLEGYLCARTGQGDASDSLSPREREVVQLLAEGKSSKRIASCLDISVKTAESHRSSIMRKLGINSIAQVVRYAVRNDLISP
jgi:DNA-binding NarL/FixJ family response regulator